MAEIVPASIATWKPFSGKGSTLLKRDIICLHTMVGTLAGSWSWANGSGRAYWHFGTGGDGQCWQCHPLEFRSASNLYGNPYVIPIENADMGVGFGPWNGQCGQVPPFTNAQINALVPLIAYLCRRYGIPANLIPDTRAGRRGIAYHRQGIQGWPEYNGGLIWSSAAGKCCPDNARIHQLKTIIIPRVRAALGGTPTPGDWFDMATEEELFDVCDRAAGKAIARQASTDGSALRTAIRSITGEEANEAVDAVIKLHEASPDSALRRLVRDELSKLTQPPE
jgi:hypothetical protein